MISRQVVEAIENLVTLEDLKEIFDIESDMTLWRWRTKRGLDECEIKIPSRERPVIRFDLDDVLIWASKNDEDTPGLKKWREKHKR